MVIVDQVIEMKDVLGEDRLAEVERLIGECFSNYFN